MESVTLKALIDQQKQIGLSDIDIIKTFFVQNDAEEDAIDLLGSLVKDELRKMKDQQLLLETCTTSLPSKYLYQNYDLDIANMLHEMELDYLVNNGKLSSSYLEWAKANVPHIDKPYCYFQPLIAWMADQGIKFKGLSES